MAQQQLLTPGACRHRFVLAVLMALLAAHPALAAPAAATASAASASAFAATARGTALGGRLTVTGYWLEGEATDSTLVLTRYNIWRPDAQIVVHSASGAQSVQGPPTTAYFRGHIAGDSASSVVLSVNAAGGMAGLALRGDGTQFMLGRSGPGGAAGPQAATVGATPGAQSLASRRTTTEELAALPPLHCGAGGGHALPQHDHAGHAHAAAARPFPARKMLADVSTGYLEACCSLHACTPMHCCTAACRLHPSPSHMPPSHPVPVDPAGGTGPGRPCQPGHRHRRRVPGAVLRRHGAGARLDRQPDCL